jgi:hypothetical protein
MLGKEYCKQSDRHSLNSKNTCKLEKNISLNISIKVGWAHIKASSSKKKLIYKVVYYSLNLMNAWKLLFKFRKVAKIRQPGSNMKVSGLMKDLRDSRMTLEAKKHCPWNNVGWFGTLRPFFPRRIFLMEVTHREPKQL